MQKPALREELARKGFRRNDDARFRVEPQEMMQTTRMVRMSMRDEHVVHLAEVDAHAVGIADVEVTGSRVEQHAMVRCLQQDAQPVFGFD